VELANHGGVIWADRFDGTLGSIFEMQDAIALQVASIVAPHLRSHELARAHRKRPESLTAYDLTLQALSLIHKLERTSFIEARRLLEQALACDAAYAPAYGSARAGRLTRMPTASQLPMPRRWLSNAIQAMRSAWQFTVIYGPICYGTTIVRRNI
jgi:hypothetical protein